MEFDLIIIGGGSAGYAAARTAREAGASVAIIDHGPLGGLCILRGCMPTKTILRSSDVIALMRRAKEFGLLPVEPKADLAAINDRKNRIIDEFPPRNQPPMFRQGAGILSIGSACGLPFSRCCKAATGHRREIAMSDHCAWSVP